MVTISFDQIVYFNQCVLLLLIFAKIKYRKCPQVKQRMGEPEDISIKIVYDEVVIKLG